MQNPKISIIIPFYNVEKYIEECIESVVNQTIKDIEIIFVNDGSTDSSATIVQKYVTADNRIKLINLEKRNGQGYARNRAIEIATGEYIGFVDSDDFVSIDMFEKLYSQAVQNDNDITMCLAQEFDDETKRFIDSDYYSLALLKEFKDTVFSAKDTKDIILNINVALWNKLYKHSYLKEIKAKFPEGYIYEDLPFFFSTFLPANRIQIVWEHLYRYRINRKTSTMNQFNNKVLDRIPMVSLTYDKLKKVSFFKDIKKEVQAWIINDLFHRYTLLEMGYHKEFFFAMKKLFIGLDVENINDSFWKKIFHFEGFKLVLDNSFDAFNQKVFHDYINIHNVQDRIVSEADGKIKDEATKVYRELDKFYDKLANLQNTTEVLFAEIKESYKFEEERRKDLVSEEEIKNDKKFDCVYSFINETKEVLTNYTNYQTDTKMAHAYNQAKEYTDNKVNENIELKKRVEDLEKELSLCKMNIEKLLTQK